MGLKKRIKELEEENKFLKETILALTKRVEELEGIAKEKSIPSFIKKDIEEESKPSGQKEGHVGYSRHVPERIDEVKEHKLDECPICGEPVSDTQEIRERIIEDIEQPKTRNTKHLIHRCYCKNCDKIVEPEIDEALPNARFGLRLMMLVLILKLDCRIPSNKVTSLLSSVFEIKISDGEIYNILKQLSEALGDYYSELERRIKEALVKNIDETSWRINGKNYWLWIFINKELALYIVRKRRSSKVPIMILGNQDGKTIISDRYSAYIHKRMKFIYRKAKENKSSKEELLNWIDLIASRKYKHTEVYKFVKSVCKNHREDLFRFIDNPQIDSTNNLAERGIRTGVVIRKISGGSRSENGAEITGRLLSVLQTAKLQSDNPLGFITNLLQRTK